jgi:hypothetical protein
MLFRGVVLATMLVAGSQSVGMDPRAHASGENACIGTLTAYDASTRALTVKTSKGVETFILAEKASVRLGSRVLPEGEIASHTGLRVKVRFTESGRKRLASSVMLSPAP